ncbi:MAG TPA: PEP-CTERM sorting domain-containing protein, partial [Thermoguttaceae bacterium]|nr:PEP-CTERM sorting domain-containing protein [Thermoguttaceae bacterium]
YAADYVLFPGLAGDSFTLVVDGPGSGLHGLEIVGVPEPPSLVLLAISTTGLVVYWRRRRAA